MLGRKVQHSGVGCLVDGQWRNVNITAAKTKKSNKTGERMKMSGRDKYSRVAKDNDKTEKDED